VSRSDLFIYLFIYLSTFFVSERSFNSLHFLKIVSCAHSILCEKPKICDHYWGHAMAWAVECHPLNSVESAPVQSVWDLQWFKWHWDGNTSSSWFQTFTMFWLLYSFFWVIPWHLNFICLVLEESFCSMFVGSLSLHCLWQWNRQSVPKCWHIKFRCEGITQKKENSILQVLIFLLYLFTSAPYSLIDLSHTLYNLSIGSVTE